MATLGSGDGFLGSTTAGAVGTYVFGGAGIDLDFGDTISGTNIQTSAAIMTMNLNSFTNIELLRQNSQVSGTWRCLGTITAVQFTDGFNNNFTGGTIFLRIA